MGKKVIKPASIKWMREHHAHLRVQDGCTVTGLLRFKANMVGNREIDIYTGVVGEKDVNRPNYVEDAYEIAFYFDDNYWPHVEEIGGRLVRRAKELNLNMTDMHVLFSNELCLGSPRVIVAEMNRDASVRNLFKSLLIPYLYYHSYWEEHGNEPWDGLLHGEIGILQDFCNYHESAASEKVINMTINCLSPHTRQRLLQKKMFPNESCFCGSGEPVKFCHPDSRIGFNFLFDAFKNNR